ncbi:hypothetical protein LCGC14_2748430 [marine sediment metagenome]|uniref:HPt domain-containing protein n=1 Tax=marine sediment metagenome TaxID=412755 RepID=A0A0F8Z2P0_9ZZZZ
MSGISPLLVLGARLLDLIARLEEEFRALEREPDHSLDKFRDLLDQVEGGVEELLCLIQEAGVLPDLYEQASCCFHRMVGVAALLQEMERPGKWN